jgi:hypothetical protein
MGTANHPKSEIPRLNVVSHIPLSREMRSHIYQKLLELDQKLPQGSALSLTLTQAKYSEEPIQPEILPEQTDENVDLAEEKSIDKSAHKSVGTSKKAAKVARKKRAPKFKILNGVEAQVEIFSPNGQMTARGFGTDLFESVSGSVATLIEEIEIMRASVQGEGGRKALIELARRPQYLH